VGLKFQRIGQALLGNVPGSGRSGSSDNRDAIGNLNQAIKLSDNALALVDDNTSAEQLGQARDRLNLFHQGAGDVFMTAATKRIRKLGHVAQVKDDSPTLRNAIDLAGADVTAVMKQLEGSEKLRERVMTEVMFNQERKMIPGIADKLPLFMDRARERMGDEAFEAMRKTTGFFDIDDISRMNDLMRDAANTGKSERLSVDEMFVINNNSNAFEEFGIRGKTDLDKRMSAMFDGAMQAWVHKDGSIQAIRKGTIEEEVAARAGAFPGSLNANKIEDLKEKTGIVSDKTLQSFGESAAAVKGVFRLASRLQTVLAESKTAQTWVGGRLSGFMNDVFINAKAIRKDVLGVEDIEFGFQDEGGFEAVSEQAFFKELTTRTNEKGTFTNFFNRMGAGAGNRALIMSDMMKMAFLGAAASEPGGRFTDRDIEAQLEILAQNQDPLIMARGLDKYKADIVAGFIAKMEGFNSVQRSKADFTGRDNQTLKPERFLDQVMLDLAEKWTLQKQVGDFDTVQPRDYQSMEADALQILASEDPNEFLRAVDIITGPNTGDPRDPDFKKQQEDALVEIFENDPVLMQMFKDFHGVGEPAATPEATPAPAPTPTPAPAPAPAPQAVPPAQQQTLNLVGSRPPETRGRRNTPRRSPPSARN
jgi:hypothetical protein